MKTIESDNTSNLLSSARKRGR